MCKKSTAKVSRSQICLPKAECGLVSLGCSLGFFGPNGPLYLGIPADAKVADACNSNGWHFPSSRSPNQDVVALRNTLLSVALPSPHRGHDVFTWGLIPNQKCYFSTKTTWNHFRPSEEKKYWPLQSGQSALFQDIVYT